VMEAVGGVLPPLPVNPMGFPFATTLPASTSSREISTAMAGRIFCAFTRTFPVSARRSSFGTDPSSRRLPKGP
jgi:hypothetical protein